MKDIKINNGIIMIIITIIIIVLMVGLCIVHNLSQDIEIIDEYNIESNNLSYYFDPSAFGLKNDIENVWGFYTDFMRRYAVCDTLGNAHIVPEYLDGRKTRVEYTDGKKPSVKRTITHSITGDIERYIITVPKEAIIIGTSMDE